MTAKGTIKITKGDLANLVKEVATSCSARKQAAPEKRTVVARVETRALKEQIRDLVKENLTAVQAVATIMDSGVIQQAFRGIAQAAVQNAAIPENQKNLAAAKIADELAKKVSAPLKITLLQALKEMGAPEQGGPQQPQQAPGGGGGNPPSPFGN